MKKKLVLLISLFGILLIASTFFILNYFGVLKIGADTVAGPTTIPLKVISKSFSGPSFKAFNGKEPYPDLVGAVTDSNDQTYVQGKVSEQWIWYQTDHPDLPTNATNIKVVATPVLKEGSPAAPLIAIGLNNNCQDAWKMMSVAFCTQFPRLSMSLSEYKGNQIFIGLQVPKAVSESDDDNSTKKTTVQIKRLDVKLTYEIPKVISGIKGTFKKKTGDAVTPFSGLEVSLYKGETLKGTVATNIDGKFEFTNQVPGEDYVIKAGQSGNQCFSYNAGVTIWEGIIDDLDDRSSAADRILSPGIQGKGKVTDKTTGNSIANFPVILFDRVGPRETLNTDSQGIYKYCLNRTEMAESEASGTLDMNLKFRSDQYYDESADIIQLGLTSINSYIDQALAGSLSAIEIDKALTPR